MSKFHSTLIPHQAWHDNAQVHLLSYFRFQEVSKPRSSFLFLDYVESHRGLNGEESN